MEVMAPETSTKAESIVSSLSSSSISSLSSASVNTLSTLSKVELDRLIAENMTSVLKSLKKRKHAKKHARIRQATEEAETIDVMETTREKKGQHSTKKKKTAQRQKKDLNVDERRISLRKNHLANNNQDVGNKSASLHHSLKEAQTKTKRKNDNGPHQTDLHNGCNQQQQPIAKNGKENKTINAFQLLMGARSKCIGSNSPGKDPESVETNPTQRVTRDEKAKRKLQLQEWAERKGSGKRKLQDEAEGEYIEHQLKKRAKRLKKLIDNLGLEKEEKEENTSIVHLSPEPKKSRRQVQRKKPSAACSMQSKHFEDHLEGASESENTSAAAIAKDKPIYIGDDTSDEFLSQLSSPRKKKDCLLGYFDKLPPCRKKQVNSGPQTKPAQKANQAIVEVVESKEELKTPGSDTSSRPRRSCANRIKDYAAFERFSPEEVEHKSAQSKKAPIVTPLKIINVQSPNTMKVVKSPSLRMFSSNGVSPAPILNGNEDSGSAEWPSTPKSVKLAPLFSKRYAGVKQQSTIDPEKARARQLFLMSGIPEKMRQDMEKRTAYEEYMLNESPVFPLVSHVTQLEQTEAISSGRSDASRKVDFKRSCIRLRPVQIESPPGRGPLKSVKSRKIRFGMFTECSAFDYETSLIKCVESTDAGDNEHEFDLPEIENVKEIVRDYKQRYQHFPVFKCYKQFRTIYQDHQLAQGNRSATGEQSQPVESGKQFGRSKRNDGRGKTTAPNDAFDDSVEIIEPTYRCRNGELLFTEKYKPQNIEQILVNYVPATLLKRFLSSWQDDSAGLRRTTITGGATQSNGDDFSSGITDNACDLSDGSTSSSATGSGGVTGICNHVVLVGPPGCGKTCNVYAVANEMNFNVLEINASSRRKGKIILQELLEATQSHQVRQKSERSNSIDSPWFRKQAGSEGGGQKTSLRNGSTSWLERRPSFSETNGNGSKKLSLILIEDADIVFEQDDGFLGAINQLVATSKRPIVLTTTNPSCAHMARYMTRNNVISYVAPGIANVAKLLSLLALVERIPIDQHDVGRLYAHNRKDMRKTLNELQFFIQSGGDMVRYLPTNGAGEFHSCEPGFDGELNETRNKKCEQSGMDEETPRSKLAVVTAKAGIIQHETLYQLFTRNQNEDMVLRLPLDFDTLWCNMELVLREAKAALAASSRLKGTGNGKKKRLSTPKRQRRQDASSRLNATTFSPEIVLGDEMGFLYENISRAEAAWASTQRNRIRYGRDLQDEQHQQQMANAMGHALVEGSWIDWFDRRRVKNGQRKEAKEEGYGSSHAPEGVKAYDGLRKLEHEQRQTIAAYIGLNGIRSRVTACEYEPLLRQICRDERNRLAQERRGCRFYHYLRNFVVSNAALGSTMSNGGASTANGCSADHFDALSQCFEEQQPNGSALQEELEMKK